MKQITHDINWMQYALRLSENAKVQNEVPIGAVLILENMILGEGWNQVVKQNDPTAHAEIVALRSAGQYHQNYRLNETTLYVTLEPCIMCVGSLLQARIRRLVFGTLNTQTGAVASQFYLLDSQKLKHRIAWEGGCMAASCRTQLDLFFRERRSALTSLTEKYA